MPLDGAKEVLDLLTAGGPAAVAAFALVWAAYERRKVDALQNRLYRLAVAGLATKGPKP